MAVPGYQAFMHPLLRLTSDQREHTLRDAADRLADEFKLSDEDRRLLLPSGEQTQLRNRVQWASTYLKKAGLLESPGRGRFRITDLGLTILRENPQTIDNAFLRRFPSFVEFVKSKPTQADREKEMPGASARTAEETPEELLQSAHESLKSALAADLLDRIRQASPQFFESLVIDLLVAMGYGGSRADAQAVGRSGDGGIDGIIKEDRLGLDAVYVQAKRWKDVVGRPIVQAFVGSLEGRKARKGVLLTTSGFSGEATDYVKHIEKRIVLIGGQELARLMIEHNVGVTQIATYTVHQIDSDYFEDE